MAATIPSGGTYPSPVVAQPLVPSTADLLAVPSGASPGLTVLARFSYQHIAQSVPLAEASNALTVTLAPTVDLPVGSTVTLSGLTGAQTLDDTALSLVIPAPYLVESSDTTTAPAEWEGGVAEWTLEGGVLVLTVGCVHPAPHTPHPAPCTLHPTPCTLHPTPYTLHPTPYTLHPTPYTPTPTSHPVGPNPRTDGLSAGVNYSLAFWLRNSADERASPLTIQVEPFP